MIGYQLISSSNPWCYGVFSSVGVVLYATREHCLISNLGCVPEFPGHRLDGVAGIRERSPYFAAALSAAKR